MRFPRAALTRSAVLITIFMIGAALVRSVADPVAVVVQIGGAVQVQRAAQPPRIPAAVGMRLMPGDRVIVPPAGRAILLHHTGRMETATRSLTLAAPQAQAPSSLFAQTVKTLAQVAATDVRAQPNRQGMIRPIAGAAVPIAPRNGVRVLQQHPTFTWFRVPDAQGYTIQLRPIGGKPVRFTTGPDTTWTPPASELPLADGTAYEWTVAALPAGRPAAPQRFQTASSQERAALTEALPQVDASRLLAALAYRDAGFLYEAWRALEKLEASGAPMNRAVRLLRAEVLNALGDLDAAAREFALADAAPDR